MLCPASVMIPCPASLSIRTPDKKLNPTAPSNRLSPSNQSLTHSNHSLNQSILNSSLLFYQEQQQQLTGLPCDDLLSSFRQNEVQVKPTSTSPPLASPSVAWLCFASPCLACLPGRRAVVPDRPSGDGNLSSESLALSCWACFCFCLATAATQTSYPRALLERPF